MNWYPIYFSVAHGVGELDIGAPPAPPPTNNNSGNYTCPYLLLDIRDKDEFDQCHIITGINFF